MRIKRRCGTASLATTLALLACAPGAGAQESIDRSFVAESGVQGYMFPGAVPALRGFDVGYTRSDHQIRRVNVGPRIIDAHAAAGDYLIALQDRDGPDAISGSVKLTDVQHLGRQLEVTRRDCRRECRLRIPNLISSQAFVLTGFSFDHGAGTDRHVLQAKVRQAAHNGYIDVRFLDNSGEGTYSAHITYAVIPRLALGPYLVQARSAGPARGESVASRPRGVALLQS
ncbi:MAG: hypothetical protein ACRELA_05530, partial [Candidatus Rokuibacteriota bacterium]